MTIINQKTNRSRALALATVSALAVAAIATSAAATTTIDGVTDTVPGTFPSPLTVDNGLIVGNTGTGELDVSSGGKVNATNCAQAFLGKAATGQGTLNIDGVGSKFDNSICGVIVGASGSGLLNVTNGGALRSLGDSEVGAGPGSTGAVSVSGAGSIWTFSGLTVGRAGSGGVSIGPGGLMTQTTCSDVNLGFNAGGVGSISVSGAGAHWSNGGCNVAVGVDGSGTLNVAAGGVLDNLGNLIVANGSSAAIEQATVTGHGSQINTNSTVIVGELGKGELNIDAGGEVTDPIAIIGDQAGSIGQVMVDGAGSTWTNNGSLTIGHQGQGALVITNGGLVTSTSGFVSGLALGGAEIEGAGSQWALSGNLFTGAQGEIDITTGGRLSNGNATVAGAAGSGALIVVDGAGSLWANSGELFFGQGVGSVLSLTIQNGGSVTDSVADIASGKITVTGPGSNWTTAVVATLGSVAFAQLYVADGGAVSVAGGTGTLFVGQAGGSNAVVNIGNSGLAPGSLLVGDVDLVLAGSELQFDHSASNYVFAPTIVGSGTVIVQSGVTTLTASNTYTGSTAVIGGTLLVDGSLASGVSVHAGGTLGGLGSIAGPVSIADGGMLQGDSSQTLSMDALSLTNAANIDVTLGAPSSTRLFFVNGDLTLDGVLNVTDGGSFGLGTYRLIDYTGALTDNGLTIGATPIGAPASNLAIQTSVAGQVNLIFSSGGAFQFWNGSTLAPTGTVVGGAGVWKVGPTNWTNAPGNASAAWTGVDGVFAGTGGAVTIDNSGGQVGAAFLQFAVDGYSLSGGTLALSGPASTIRVGDGTLAGAGYTASISSILAGSAGLAKTDLGTLVLSGTNTYLGGTTLSGGFVSVGADANLGDATGGITFNGGGLLATSSFASNRNIVFTGAGAIDVAANAFLDLTGAITGSDALTKTGTGALGLDGLSSYSGGVTIADGTVRVNGSVDSNMLVQSGGRLQVNGTVGGTVDVQSGARLQGAGTVGATNIDAGGFLEMGPAIATLTVEGDLVFQPGSTFVVGVNAAGHSDLVNSTEAVAAGGTVSVLAAPGVYSLGTQYTIVSSNLGVVDAFSSLTQNLNQPFLQLSLAYDANDVFLNVTRNSASFCSVAVTKNQCASAGGAESLGAANGLYDAIANLPTAASAQGAFDALSGEVNASVRGVEVEDSRFVRDAAIDRLRQSHDDGHATWAQIFAAQGSVDGDGNAADLTRTVGGFLMGADTPADADWRLGVLGGYSQTRFSVGARDSSGSSDDYHLGVYGGAQGGVLKARFGAAYSWHDITTSRAVMFPGFADADKGAARSGDGQVFGELAYPMGKPDRSLEPFASLAYVTLRSDGFTETGGAAALHSASDQTQTSFATVGLRGETRTSVDGAAVSLRGSVAWRGAYGDVTPDARQSFSPGGAAFTVDGAPIARDALVVDADLGVKVSARARLSLDYVGQTSASAHDDAVKGGLTISF